MMTEYFKLHYSTTTSQSEPRTNLYRYGMLLLRAKPGYFGGTDRSKATKIITPQPPPGPQALASENSTISISITSTATVIAIAIIRIQHHQNSCLLLEHAVAWCCMNYVHMSTYLPI